MGFSMGGYVAAAFAARHPELVCGVLMGACCHDAHSASWKMVGRLAELVYKLCSYKTKSQVVCRMMCPTSSVCVCLVEEVVFTP